eukprot:TRINITY_DN2875_c0_g1_i10.p1 TRINITY_DN2875_c0_g1~~TRINITY_DN2875_c0_g1_i10.p1  ORF type:complete len:355 (-),score=37.22 TRINITY_DN2875_c0_g1_i10:353-1417(-)
MIRLDESVVVNWTCDDVLNWAMKYVDERYALKLKEQVVDGSALLAFSKRDFKDCGIPIGPSAKLYSAVQKMQSSEQPARTRSINLPREEKVWLYTVYVSIDGGDDCTGILLQSQTSPENRHLLLNLHSFAEKKEDFLPYPVPGFPSVYDDEFKLLFPKKRGKKPNTPSDPIEIKISRVQFVGESGKKIEKIIPIQSFVIGKDDIIFCSGKQDVLVLFDIPFDKMEAAPISLELRRSDRVHLYGFTHLSTEKPATSFVLTGEITRIEGVEMNISALTSPGLSGGAVVLDDTGFVVGYIGGSVLNPDAFGSYAFSILPVSVSVSNIDEKKKIRSEAIEKRELEDNREKEGKGRSKT